MEVFEYLVQTSRGALWSAGMSYWIRVPKGSNKFLVQVDKDQLLAKFRHLEVGVRLALSEILPKLPEPPALEFDMPFGIPFQARDCIR